MKNPSRRLISTALLASLCILTFKTKGIAQTNNSSIELPFCFKAIKLAEPENDHIYDPKIRPLVKACIDAVYAERKNMITHSSDALSTDEDRAKVKKYMEIALSLHQKYDQGDLATLVSFGVATPQIDPGKYLPEYYRTHGIKIAAPGEYPVRVFENSEVPLPTQVRDIAWIDNDNIVYPANDTKHSILDFSSSADADRKEPITTVNLKTLRVKSDYELPDLVNIIKRIAPQWEIAGPVADNCWAAEILLQANPVKKPLVCHGNGNLLVHENDRSSPFYGCLKLLKEDGYACHLKLPETEAEKINGQYRSDLKTIVIKSEKGDEKALTFNKQLESIRINYDFFSNTYWITADENVWRYDRRFNKISEESYAKGFWGDGRCAVNHGVGEVACVWLDHMVRAGFLIDRHAILRDKDDPKKELFDAGGIFLLTKDGQALKIHDKLEQYSSGFSISPDGCKAIFIQTDVSGKLEPGKTYHNYHGAKSRVAMVDVCKNSETKNQ